MKNKHKLQKRIKRFGMVETNSSSSHTLSIGHNPDRLIKRGDPDFNLEIRDNKLYVPLVNTVEDLNFGWGWTKYNDCKTRLLYAAGLMYSSSDEGKVISYKKVNKLKSILKKYLEVDDVIFDWDTEYLKGNSDFVNFPDIDHQGKFFNLDQVYENYDTAINFIFSRDTWLYCGNDNSNEPNGFFDECFVVEDPKIVIRVDFSKVGFEQEVDFVVPEDFRDFHSYWSGNIVNTGVSGKCFLGLENEIGLEINTESGVVLNQVYDNKFNAHTPKNLTRTAVVFDAEENLNVIFFKDVDSKYVTKEERDMTEEPVDITYLLTGNKQSKDAEIMINAEEDKNIVSIIKKYFKEGEDFEIFPAKILFLEFDEFDKNTWI